MLAIFRLFKDNDNAYYLRLPKDILDSTLARLKMFVLMSKVTLEDVSDIMTGIGITGENAADIVATVYVALHLPILAKRTPVDGISILRVHPV